MLASDWLMEILSNQIRGKGSTIDYVTGQIFLPKASVQNRALSEILVLNFGDNSEICFVNNQH